MLVSIAVIIKKEDNVTAKSNAFMKRIDKLKYPKHELEVVFIVLGSPNEGMRVIKSSPLIRVVQLKGYLMGTVLSFCVTKCHGDFFILANLETQLNENSIKSLGVNFWKVRKLALVIKPDLIAMRKLNIKFPEDLFDFKTYLILYSIINEYRVMGSWGKLHKKEVQRFYYKFDKIPLLQKLHILLKTVV